MILSENTENNILIKSIRYTPSFPLGVVVIPIGQLYFTFLKIRKVSFREL